MTNNEWTKDDASHLIDVSIIYVNWNCVDEIVESIASVREKTAGCTYEIIVVDNNSEQGIGPLADDSRVEVIYSERNGGFGAGCNLGATQAKGKYLFFLNPDTRLLNDAVTELLRFMDAHPLAGIAGAMVEDSNGTVMFDGARSLPSLRTEFLQHSTLSFRFPDGRWTSAPYLSNWDHRSTREVGSVIGACMMIRQWDFRFLNGFDEAFFLYCEEVDLCRRVRDKGLGVWYVPNAKIFHKERQSTIKLYGTVNRVILQNLKSQLYYFRKHNGAICALAWRSMLVAIYMIRYVVRRDPSYLEYVRWAARA